MRHRSLPAILFTLVALGGCGQKGPLYLPQDPAVPGTEAATTPAAPPVPTSPTGTAEALEEGEAVLRTGPAVTPAGADAAGPADSTEQQTEQQEVDR